MEILLAEPRGHQPEVALGDVGAAADLAAEHAAPDGRVGHDGDAELAAGGQEAVGGRLDVQREGAVLDLHRGDGVDGVRAAERRGADLGEAEVSEFASLFEGGHGVDGFFDGGFAVDAVAVLRGGCGLASWYFLGFSRCARSGSARGMARGTRTIKIHGREAQPLERLLARGLAVLGAAVEGASPVREGLAGELGREEDVLSLLRVRLEPLAEEILAIHIHVGRILSQGRLVLDF